MKITSLDIQKKTFKRAWRGLDENEVDRFLDLVATEIEELVEESIAQKEELRRRATRLEEYAERERALQETLLSAQKYTAELKGQSKKEADLLLLEAETKAQQIVQEAHNRYVQIISEINELKRLKLQFSISIKRAVESHISLLDALSDEEKSKTAIDNVEYLPFGTGPMKADAGRE